MLILLISPSNLNHRDVIAVRRTVSGLLKLLHPNSKDSKGDVRMSHLCIRNSTFG
ncbi:hypothetical protein XNC1_2931 [Xenorhabdus nematophila ATCC 19061]|uniref:Uncharacterized protein n=1 Tax=Xenorhabdus nematophila (strain ATCC 19061 / DSM 3370 / CCUG 14189 / LMG 1036 / NCIMB 9965 / AN6) TaxID=406817 RepID=D3VJS6_XENNA|nr:hypothetical protein XNC1_2931 [Xenorhabdus nematophila ATCC 19061]